MLILEITDREDDLIRIGDDITVSVSNIVNSNKVKLGVHAPLTVPVGKAETAISPPPNNQDKPKSIPIRVKKSRLSKARLDESFSGA